MHAVEYYGWQRYFRRNPPASATVPLLLARLCAAFETFASGEKVALRDVAPWLPKKVEKQGEPAKLSPEWKAARAAMTAAAFQRAKERADG